MKVSQHILRASVTCFFLIDNEDWETLNPLTQPAWLGRIQILIKEKTSYKTTEITNQTCMNVGMALKTEHLQPSLLIILMGSFHIMHDFLKFCTIITFTLHNHIFLLSSLSVSGSLRQFFQPFTLLRSKPIIQLEIVTSINSLSTIK